MGPAAMDIKYLSTLAGWGVARIPHLPAPQQWDSTPFF